MRALKSCQYPVESAAANVRAPKIADAILRTALLSKEAKMDVRSGAPMAKENEYADMR
jgi:hypothetical protein